MAKVNTNNSNKLNSKRKKEFSWYVKTLLSRTLPYEIVEKMEKGS